MEAPRILVVDDDPNMLLLIRFNLERRGWTVVVAEDGLTGLRLATEQPFDLVVLDVMLPGMSGFEVCRTVRSHEAGRNLPILLLTARSQMEDFEEASNVGATDYVLKPFDPIALTDQIAAHIASGTGSES